MRLALAFLCGMLVTHASGGLRAAVPPAPSRLHVLWPPQGAMLTGIVSLRAVVPGMRPDEYVMQWRTGGSGWKTMEGNYVGTPHKTALISAASLSEDESAAHTLAFRATDKRGRPIGTASVSITARRPGRLPLAADERADTRPIVKASSSSFSSSSGLHRAAPAPVPTSAEQRSTSSVSSAKTSSSVRSLATASIRSSAPAIPSPIVPPARQPTAALSSQSSIFSSSRSSSQSLASFASSPHSFSSASSIASSSKSAVSLDVWWPMENAVLSGEQPFKSVVPGIPLSEYQAYWRVDGGQLNVMSDDVRDFPHKEATVSLYAWTWRGRGPYALTFVAKKGDHTIAQKTFSIYVANGSDSAPPPPPAAVLVASSSSSKSSSIAVASATQASTKSSVSSSLASSASSESSPAPSPLPPPSIARSGNPLSGLSFYVRPDSPAKRQANEWRASRPSDAALMDLIGDQPQAQWIGGWNFNVESDVRSTTDAAAARGQVPVFIAYNIPQRDCGGYSAGGIGSPEAYRSWMQSVARGIGSRRAVVILEPDSLALMQCLSESDKQTRMGLLAEFVRTLKAAGAVSVYLDAGHAFWVSAHDMAPLLLQSGIAQADGFALNVSNFTRTEDNTGYGNRLSALTGGAHYVIDTSRNGLGPAPDSQWCNPPGRALGARPTASTGNPLADAYLWLKTPGESDGACNGGPSAGQWWAEYGLGLAERAGY